MHHVRRGAHHVLRWVASVAAVLILVVLFGIWRVMEGPVELDWLAPTVEAALARSGLGLKVTISGVRLGIDRTSHQLDLRAENVRVYLPNGEPLASFPEMATSFGLDELLRARLALTQVVVERPILHLVRDAGGMITARIGSGDDAAPDLAPPMLEQLISPPERDAPLGLLRRLSIRGATVIVDDRRSGQTWRADRVDLSVERAAKGVRGDFSLAIPIGASLPELHASYRYLAERHLLDLEIAIDGVDPAAIPPLIPELAQLRHVEAPVSGTLRTRIDLTQRQAQGSRLDFVLGAGRLNSEWLPKGSVGIDKGELHAVYAPESEELRVERLALDLGGGTEFALDGTLAGVTPELIAAPADARPPSHLTGTLAVALKNVPVARFGELWPTALSPGGRRWTIDNIHDGVLDEATVRLGLDLDPVAHTANVANAQGSLRYHDLSVNYFNGLPWVRQVGGTASFAGNHLDFTPTSGTIKGVKVTGGTLQISDLDQRIEWLTIDLGLAGPLQDMLEIIDSKPLRYAHAIGVDPSHVGGRAETQVHFALPLIADLKLDSVDYNAKATITGASIGKVAFDRGISDGNVSLEVGRNGARLQGNIRFDEIPAKLDANVLFHPKSGPRAVYKLGLTLYEAAQRRLDLDFIADRLTGPIAADVTYNVLSTTRGEATALLDLRTAGLALPEAGWKKPPDQPATAKVVLDIENGRIAQVPQIEVKAAGLDGRLAVLLTADRKQVERVEIRRFLVGENEVSGAVSRRAAAGWRADIHAARIDARHLLKDAMNAGRAESSPPLALDTKIDRLVLGPKRELHQVTAALMRTGGNWQSGRIDGRYANGRRASLRFGEDEGRRLVFESDDFGAALQLFDIADGVVGGHVSVNGQLSSVAGKRTLRAQIEGQNYTLVRAPAMTRILALPSLTGFASTLSGAGLPFSDVRGEFVFNGSRLTLERFLAFGEAIGVTANGWVDIDRDWLELQGTVAPAYALNSIIGNVPIVGKLLGGGSQGLFAANYRLSGASADPQVSVNPLSALAPGILRQLFSPIVGLPTVEAEQQAAD